MSQFEKKRPSQRYPGNQSRKSRPIAEIDDNLRLQHMIEMVSNIVCWESGHLVSSDLLGFELTRTHSMSHSALFYFLFPCNLGAIRFSFSIEISPGHFAIVAIGIAKSLHRESAFHFENPNFQICLPSPKVLLIACRSCVHLAFWTRKPGLSKSSAELDRPKWSHNIL
jgi:hypothetical protein